MSKASVIRPGLLVAVRSTVAGGVSYQRVDLDAAEIDCPDCVEGDTATERSACKTCGGTGKVSSSEGREVTRWETKRTIEDAAEHKRATAARSAARALITKCCSVTSFGLLCPEDQEGALDAAVAKARELVAEHNKGATHTQVSILVFKGRVASNDAEAARAITAELAGLVQQMDAGIKEFDPKKIRDAADKARQMSNMLDDSKKGKIDAAIAQARAAARAIVKRFQNENEARETVLLDIQRGQIESARIAFLDMSDEQTETAEPVPAVNVQRFADLDIETVGDAKARGVLGLEDVEDNAVISRQPRQIEIES